MANPDEERSFELRLEPQGKLTVQLRWAPAGGMGAQGQPGRSQPIDSEVEDVRSLLQVTLVSGHNLLPADANGKSDPYAVRHMTH